MHAPVPTAFRPDSPAAWRRLGLVLLIATVGSVGMWSVVVVLPVVQAEFAATRADVSLAFTMTMIGFGVGGVVTGRLSDKVGILPAIAIGLFCAVAMAVLLIVLRSILRGTSRQTQATMLPKVDLGISTNALTVILCLASFACCVAMSMPQVHIVAYCGDLGYGVARGAEMLSLMLAFGIISRIGSGMLADRFGGMVTLLIGSVAQACALTLYVFFNGLTSLYVVSALFGLFQGGLVPSYALVVRETMPVNQAATRVGIVIGVSVAGMAFGGWVSGLIFDATGSYRAAFLNGVAWNALNMGIVLMLLLRARSRAAFA